MPSLFSRPATARQTRCTHFPQWADLFWSLSRRPASQRPPLCRNVSSGSADTPGVSASTEVTDTGRLTHTRFQTWRWMIAGRCISVVSLPRSLGYGKYNVLLEGVEKLEPATVFDMFTWDDAGTDQDRREWDTLLARWGDPNAKNGEYEVQPFYRPTNTYRYSI